MKWDRVRRDLEDGIGTVKWLGRFLAERTRVETALAKVLYDAQKIRKKIEDRYLELGESIYELRDDRQALDNATIRDLLGQIQTLKEELDHCLVRARELGGEEFDEVRTDAKPYGRRSTDVATSQASDASEPPPASAH